MSVPYHVPVMAREVLQFLVHKKNGIYIDGTLGGAGHAKIILQHLASDGKYIGVDRDIDAINIAQIELVDYKNFRAYKTTFDDIHEILKEENIKKVDGILLDLGISSWQIDNDDRGFSFRNGINLDMRMDKYETESAEWIINNYSEQDLKKVFREYGEERHSGKIANLIVKARTKIRISKSQDLTAIIDRCVNGKFRVKSYARIFQALRIAVNNELEILKKALSKMTDIMAENARLVIITYHSLEDRIVKNFIQEMAHPCVCPPELPICACGKKAILKKNKPAFLSPSDEEIKNNSRARSAKLRVAYKV